MLRKYKDLMEKLREPVGENSFYTYMTYQRMGNLYEQWEKWPEAEATYRKAINLADSALGADGPFAVEGRESLASMLALRGRYAESVQVFEQVINTLQQKPSIWAIRGRDTLGEDYFELAQNYFYLDRFEEAERSLRKAADIFEANGERDLINGINCLSWNWVIDRALRKQDQGTKFYKTIIELVESHIAGPSSDKKIGAALQDTARWFSGKQEYAKAQELLRLAIRVQEKAYGPKSPEIARAWESLGDVADTAKQYGMALNSFKKALAICEETSDIDVQRINEICYKIALAHYEREEFQDADRQLQELLSSLAHAQKQSADTTTQQVWARYLLGLTQRHSGKYASAEEHLKAVLQSDQNSQPPKPVDVISDLLALAGNSRLRGNQTAAEQWLNRAEVLLREIKNSDDMVPTRAWFKYESALLLLVNGKTGRAEEMLREAIKKAAAHPQMNQVLFLKFIDDYVLLLNRQGKQKDASGFAQEANEIRGRLKRQ